MADAKPTIATFTPALAKLIADYVRQEVAKAVAARTPPSNEITVRQIVWCKITGNATGSGKYSAKLFTPGTIEISSSADLTAADFGVLADADNVLFLNAEEVDLEDSHVLTEGDETPLAIGTFHGLNTESPPLHVVKGFSILSGCDE